MSYLKKINSILFPKIDLIKPDATPFDFVKTKKNIVRELMLSKESGNVVGIYCKALGSGMFLTCVEDLKSDIVVLHRYEMSGQKLATNTIYLDEIQFVLPFSKAFRNPAPLGRVHRIKGLGTNLSVA